MDAEKLGLSRASYKNTRFGNQDNVQSFPGLREDFLLTVASKIHNAEIVDSGLGAARFVHRGRTSDRYRYEYGNTPSKFEERKWGSYGNLAQKLGIPSVSSHYANAETVKSRYRDLPLLYNSGFGKTHYTKSHVKNTRLNTKNVFDKNGNIQSTNSNLQNHALETVTGKENLRTDNIQSGVDNDNGKEAFIDPEVKKVILSTNVEDILKNIRTSNKESKTIKSNKFRRFGEKIKFSKNNRKKLLLSSEPSDIDQTKFENEFIPKEKQNNNLHQYKKSNKTKIDTMTTEITIIDKEFNTETNQSQSFNDSKNNNQTKLKETYNIDKIKNKAVNNNISVDKLVDLVDSTQIENIKSKHESMYENSEIFHDDAKENNSNDAYNNDSTVNVTSFTDNSDSKTLSESDFDNNNLTTFNEDTTDFNFISSVVNSTNVDKVDPTKIFKINNSETNENISYVDNISEIALKTIDDNQMLNNKNTSVSYNKDNGTTAVNTNFNSDAYFFDDMDYDKSVIGIDKKSESLNYILVSHTNNPINNTNDNTDTEITETDSILDDNFTTDTPDTFTAERSNIEFSKTSTLNSNDINNSNNSVTATIIKPLYSIESTTTFQPLTDSNNLNQMITVNTESGISNNESYIETNNENAKINIYLNTETSDDADTFTTETSTININNTSYYSPINDITGGTYELQNTTTTSNPNTDVADINDSQSILMITTTSNYNLADSNSTNTNEKTLLSNILSNDTDKLSVDVTTVGNEQTDDVKETNDTSNSFAKFISNTDDYSTNQPYINTTDSNNNVYSEITTTESLSADHIKNDDISKIELYTNDLEKIYNQSSIYTIEPESNTDSEDINDISTTQPEKLDSTNTINLFSTYPETTNTNMERPNNSETSTADTTMVNSSSDTGSLSRKITDNIRSISVTDSYIDHNKPTIPELNMNTAVSYTDDLTSNLYSNVTFDTYTTAHTVNSDFVTENIAQSLNKKTNNLNVAGTYSDTLNDNVSTTETTIPLNINTNTSNASEMTTIANIDVTYSYVSDISETNLNSNMAVTAYSDSDLTTKINTTPTPDIDLNKESENSNTDSTTTTNSEVKSNLNRNSTSGLNGESTELPPTANNKVSAVHYTEDTFSLNTNITARNTSLDTTDSNVETTTLDDKEGTFGVEDSPSSNNYDVTTVTNMISTVPNTNEGYIDLNTENISSSIEAPFTNIKSSADNINEFSQKLTAFDTYDFNTDIATANLNTVNTNTDNQSINESTDSSTNVNNNFKSTESLTIISNTNSTGTDHKLTPGFNNEITTKEPENRINNAGIPESTDFTSATGVPRDVYTIDNNSNNKPTNIGTGIDKNNTQEPLKATYESKTDDNDSKSDENASKLISDEKAALYSGSNPTDSGSAES